MVTEKAIKVGKLILKAIEKNREHKRETYDDILVRMLKLNSKGWKR
jgi:hypothetical protein